MSAFRSVIATCLVASAGLAGCFPPDNGGSTPGPTPTRRPTGSGTPTPAATLSGTSTPRPTPAGTPSANVSVADTDDPTDAEQLMLELVNRARRDPVAEAARLGLSSVTEGTIPGQISTAAQPPLTMNAKLLAAARGHSQDMLDRDFFAHDNPDGADPFERMQGAGYQLLTGGENIAFQGTTGAVDVAAFTATMYDSLFVDRDYPNRGHRVNILRGSFREVGIGVRDGLFTDSRSGITFNAVMATQDFGAATGDHPFVLGVVYDDANGNAFYDSGEGLGGVAVELAGVVAVTPASGGYAFNVTAAGTYSISFDGGALTGRLAGIVAVADANRKVDAVAGVGLVGAD